jgi:hypothetical protein
MERLCQKRLELGQYGLELPFLNESVGDAPLSSMHTRSDGNAEVEFNGLLATTILYASTARCIGCARLTSLCDFQMETHVEFRSDRFPPFEGEEKLLNPDLWGSDWLIFFGRACAGRDLKRMNPSRRIGAGSCRWLTRHFVYGSAVVTTKSTRTDFFAS